MAIAPGNKPASGPALPWLPLPAILAFSVLGLGGSIFLTYTIFSHTETRRPVTASNDDKVYAARPIPFNSSGENPAQRAAIARALSATQVQVRNAQALDPARPGILQPLLLADSDRELQGFQGFVNSGAANNYLTVTGRSLGISAEGMPSGFLAADAERFTSAPVPEASTWMCGAALLVLVGARGLRARLHRKRTRH